MEAGLDDLDRREQDVLLDLFRAERDEIIPFEEGGGGIAYDLLLLLAGVRPGILIYQGYADFDDIRAGPLYSALERLDIPRLVVLESRQYYENDVPVSFETPDGTVTVADAPEYRRSNDRFHETYYVSLDPDRLHGFNHQDHREFAEFLGYPAPSVDAFLDRDDSFRTPLPEYVATLSDEDGVPLADVGYATLIRYAARRHPDSICTAIERGKRYYAVCEEFDALTGTSVATDYADDCIDRFLEQV